MFWGARNKILITFGVNCRKEMVVLQTCSLYIILDMAIFYHFHIFLVYRVSYFTNGRF